MDQPPTSPQPVFIDFEGIDGSGKTTLSNKLADYLKTQGITCHHARDRGVFRSEISREIRMLTRDPRFLRMSDVTELLLYVARDTQIVDEFIRPKMNPGNVVFSDRYLYSAVVHSHFARGVPRDQVDSVVDIAAGGLWPDVVVYCDVDPLTSRMRKKIQKVRDQRKLGDFGRKGLMGIGFREDMRDGFLALAKEDPERWIVIDNAKGSIEESLQKIFDRIAKVLEAKGYGEIKNPNWASPYADVVTMASPLIGHIDELLSISDQKERERALYSLYFEQMSQMVDRNPGYAGLLVVALDCPEAHELRLRLIDKEPSLVAYGLRGLRSPEAMELRERLKDSQPEYIARSLSGLSDEDPVVTRLREELVSRAPAYVALSIRGKDTPHAWKIRQEIGKKAIREVLLSLRGLDTAEAWALREKRARKGHFAPLLESLVGLDTDRAWEWRRDLIEEYLPWVLMSLRGVYSEESWKLRQEHVIRAPKIIVKSIGRSDDPRAWELREASKFYAKEVLDSLSGLDSGNAWQLRYDLKDKWPNTAVSSLGAGAQSERAWKFRWDMLKEHPENLLLMKHLVKASMRADADVGEYDEEDEADFT